ncbi:UPF0061 protein [Amylibacter marinus]|uniref:Protein nucleotidyltransferase YdiU n=1 Tax=Amylibacter marinus TaxID=1475483 RepID=A0ABQ5VUD1_9RHOB|nr:YdiU family protein [Amylibacter marinus]GLQ35060.1 UPF0061 protein [Amylibacter marinus]
MKFDNTFYDQMQGFYAEVGPEAPPSPELLLFNTALADELGLDLRDQNKAALFSGAEIPAGAAPLAQVYAGHQFGGFSAQLGDGRAILLGEITSPSGARMDIQLKGSGQTPFSRNGDGKAALGPVLREYIMGEAMHALNIPTTRALAATTTGARVQRETGLPGAVLTRIASSHIRVGTFQFFAARGQNDQVKQLADYAIARHFPDISTSDTPYLDFLRAVADRQAALIAKWIAVGFIHGVMNTDNMAISGETIDYGPCAFMDTYDLKTVFSSIDRQGRYAYGNQPLIARWNLARLAETLLPLLSNDDDTAIQLATTIIDDFAPTYEAAWLAEMRKKFGLISADGGDADLANDFLNLLAQHKLDFTTAFRALTSSSEHPNLFQDIDAFANWKARYRARCAGEHKTKSRALMRANNPIYIPRNHLVEQALDAAQSEGDLGPVKSLLTRLKSPFDDTMVDTKYAQPPATVNSGYKTFCGT